MTRIHFTDGRTTRAGWRLHYRMEIRAPRREKASVVRPREVSFVDTRTAEQRAAFNRGLAEAVNAEQDARNARPGAWW